MLQNIRFIVISDILMKYTNFSSKFDLIHFFHESNHQGFGYQSIEATTSYEHLLTLIKFVLYKRTNPINLFSTISIFNNQTTESIGWCQV